MPSPLHHLAQGSGPTVVLLHAGVADLRMWDHQAAALATDEHEAKDQLTAFLDADVGQTSVGPPATIRPTRRSRRRMQ